MSTGRNEPCPCGSGIKYKKCCADKEGRIRSDAPAPVVMNDLHQALAGQEFASLAEAQVFIEEFVSKKNFTFLDDFAGLSPEEMFRFVNYPWDSPEVVTFPPALAAAPAAPLLRLFELLVSAIGEDGLKPTATGNLPRNFCREAALAFWGEEGYRKETHFGGINKEDDFSELHVTRLVGELAGLIRKYRGRFILSRECRRLLAEGGTKALYPRLLKAYIRDYNWGYRDRYAELPFIQHAFLFPLYLLQKFGSEDRPQSFYEDAFLRAFPQILAEVPPQNYFPPERTVRNCFTVRALIRFADFCGLATVRPIEENNILCQDYRVKKLPLLDEVVRFQLPR